jgi:hypothetical protein
MSQTTAIPTRYQHITDQRWFIRFLEIIPGTVSWTFIIGPIILSLFAPLVVAYFIVAFDLYWLIKALRMSVYLIRGYRRLRRTQATDWTERLEWLRDPAPFIVRADHACAAQVERHPRVTSFWQFNRVGMQRHRHYLDTIAELDTLKEIEARQSAILDPSDIYHLAIVATYNESRDILEPTIVSLLESKYPAKQVMLIIAYEERGGETVKENAEALIAKYGPRFAYAEAIMHPDGIVGEVRGKGGNITFAGRRAAAYIESQGIAAERVIVTTFDADNKPDPQYLAYLSYTYAINPNRIRKSYQPVPMFFNNIWDAPAPMRVIATGNSFWMVMEMMRPHRLRNFSTHAQPLRALIETDFWSVTTPVEDGHQFWRSFFTFNGDYEVVPLYMPIYQDAVLADTYRKTFVAQYKQLRRWAYGVSDFSFVIRNDIRNKQVPLGSKIVQTWRLFEGHVSWATATLIITFVAWLPLFLNPHFSQYELAQQLPIIASYIQRVAILGLLITVSISVISLPPRPKRYTRRRTFAMVAQWIMLPVTGILFNAITAIDAQTRLMLGRYLEFQVTEKSRKS